MFSTQSCKISWITSVLPFYFPNSESICTLMSLCVTLWLSPFSFHIIDSLPIDLRYVPYFVFCGDLSFQKDLNLLTQLRWAIMLWAFLVFHKYLPKWANKFSSLLIGLLLKLPVKYLRWLYDYPGEFYINIMSLLSIASWYVQYINCISQVSCPAQWMAGLHSGN